VKLIAEPWDVGEGGYQVGEFPPLWTEWNDKFRDTARDFWRGARTDVRDLAYRISGSSDLYQDDGRRPYASINFITAHDGFTMRDLVTYERKHNDEHGEDNRDGSNDNRSCNYGVEGETDDVEINLVRRRQIRNLLTMMLLATGVPMLVAGDEMGRTQNGNNNAYCQDNELTWFDWNNTDKDLLDFTRQLIAFRRDHPVFRRRRFLAGAEAAELAWFTPAGAPMDDGDWADPEALAIGIYLDGSDDPDRAEDGTLLIDDDFLVLVNAWWEPLSFTIPSTSPDHRWETEIDTFDLTAPASTGPVPAVAGPVVAGPVVAGPRSIVVLRSSPPGGS
jgi:isoamylase